MESVRHLVIVKVTQGMRILDRPAPQSKGAVTRRIVPNGTTLDAHSIHYIEGVPYARLVPQYLNKPEYIRIAERDESTVYCDVIDLEAEPKADDIRALIEILTRVAEALEGKI